MAEIIEHPRMVAIYDALDPTAATLIRTPPTLTIGAPRRVRDVGLRDRQFPVLLAGRVRESRSAPPGIQAVPVHLTGEGRRSWRSRPVYKRMPTKWPAKDPGIQLRKSSAGAYVFQETIRR